MPDDRALVNLTKHPCYSHHAHCRYARVHLPVARGCNLGCNYCEAQIGGASYHSYRPAVTNRVLTPREALAQLERTASLSEVTVAGIAGPGEPLCQSSTFETLELIQKRFPALMLCISTNGLLLCEHAERLRSLGVCTLTVTLNAVSPEIGKLIYRYVEYDGKTLTGVEGAQTLLGRQLAGIEEAASMGIVVKINSILIPGVNDNGHLVEVAIAAKRLGAQIQNITALIPVGRFKGVRPPSCEELWEMRARCEQIIPQFWLCRQCRADSAGIPGRAEFPREQQSDSSL